MGKAPQTATRYATRQSFGIANSGYPEILREIHDLYVKTQVFYFALCWFTFRRVHGQSESILLVQTEVD